MQATQKLAGKKKVDLKARLEEEAAAAQEDKEEGLLTFFFCFLDIIIRYYIFILPILHLYININILGVKVQNMKMDFDVGGTWHWIRQGKLIMKNDFLNFSKVIIKQ